MSNPQLDHSSCFHSRFLPLILLLSATIQAHNSASGQVCGTTEMRAQCSCSTGTDRKGPSGLQGAATNATLQPSKQEDCWHAWLDATCQPPSAAAPACPAIHLEVWCGMARSMCAARQLLLFPLLVEGEALHSILLTYSTSVEGCRRTAAGKYRSAVGQVTERSGCAQLASRAATGTGQKSQGESTVEAIDCDGPACRG